MRLAIIALAIALLSVVALAAASSDVADAAMKKDAQAVRSLIQNKADVNAAQTDGSTALHWAARWDDLDMAGALIRAGANSTTPNRDGATPLFLAAQNGSAAMIDALLKAGADANAPVLSNGETALMMAARTGKLDAARILLDRGARVDAAETLRGTTALMWAAAEGHAAMVRFLLDRGADVAVQSKVLRPIRRNGLTLVAAGRGAAADPTGGLTALLLASREGSLETVRVLVDAGANDAGNQQASADGSAPLLVAVQNGHYAIARFLLDRGALPIQANAKGWTPLYLAVAHRNALTTAVPPPPADGVLDFIATLLDRGADPNARIQVHTETHQANTSLWLKEDGATPLLRAALCGDLTVARLLLAHGADPRIATFDRTSPLMVASGVGWAEGFTFERSEDETLELVKLLLEKGAAVNEANTDGITPLHGAAYKGANKVVQLLVDRGANLAALDEGKDYGFGASTVRMTPLNWAEGVPIGMSSAIYHASTAALLTRLMEAQGIPVVHNAFQVRKPAEAPPSDGAK